MYCENNENKDIQEKTLSGELTENTTKEDSETNESSEATQNAETAESTEKAEVIEVIEVIEVNENCELNELTEETEQTQTTLDFSIKDEDAKKIEDEDQEPREDKSKKEEGSFLRFLYETLEMVAISIAIVILLITFVVRYSPVSGESMTYTINENDSLLVQIAFYEPKRNDIVILQAPNYDLDKPLIKRVIAIGGDELFINFNTWEVKVNGITIDEYYVRHNPYIFDPENDSVGSDVMEHQNIYNIPGGNFDAEKNTFSATVPEGTIFVMGDNRNNSHDSRSANVGFVDEKCVIGKAFFRLFPLSDIGPLK